MKKVYTDPLGRKLTLASQKKVKKLIPWIDLILDTLGHPEALVTDESSLSDFLKSNAERAEFYKKLKISPNSDKIVDIAIQLKDKK
jgi:hypothetical protein